MSVSANLHPAWVRGELNRRIFGSFVEHMGRCVYTGIYEPDHPTADEHGFRGDVAELVAEMGPTIVRYPGGNFVSGYNWEDGVGPRDERPTRFDFAWRSIETNQVGTNEFLAWCERLGIEPMLAINLGTRGLAEGMEYLEYVNGEAGTKFADLRIAHGRTEPWGVKVWCLGNEMDGPWQMGHKTPVEYARLAQEVGNAYKRFDESLELVACGSSNPTMPTFGEWERVTLEAAFDQVDVISAHSYYEPAENPDGSDDFTSFACAADQMDRYIRKIVATCDHVAALKQSEKKIMISFDEWNVWFQRRFGGENAIEVEEAPRLIEDHYTALDAMVVGSFLITLMQHTDRVAMACQAQLVNIIAPIRTEPGGAAWRQTIFHPFALTSRYAKGTVLDLAIDSPLIETRQFGDCQALVATATHDADTGEVAVFVCNRDLTSSHELSLEVGGFGAAAQISIVEHHAIAEDDLHLGNDHDHPDRVAPKTGSSQITGSSLTATLPAGSWHLIRLSTRTAQS